MTSSNQAEYRRWTLRRITIVALAFLTLWGFATTLYFWSENQDITTGVNSNKLYTERLLAEKLQLEKQIVDINGRLDQREEALGESEHRVDDLRRRVEEAVKHSKGLERAAAKCNDLSKQVTELRMVKVRLEQELSRANESEHDLQQRLDELVSERDGLAASLEEHKAGARMVNNAEVDAIRGKKGKLTVIARRAQEIRMAFDLPESLAERTTFNIITPDGQSITGGHPSISMSIDEVEAEPTASIDLIPEAVGNERAARVHLRYNPLDKLKPGTYRIDVMSGGDYLSSVLLNLR